MSQFPHDEFAKEYLPELYQDYGIVEPSLDIMSEKKEIDLLFTPSKPVPTTSDTLGLLGRLAQSTCLLEVYRNAINAEHIKDCIVKLITVQKRDVNLTKKDKVTRKSAFLWILTPTISQKILEKSKSESREEWETGVYFLPEIFNTGIIAIHQLPETRNTLWLRILGKGNKQIKAIEEVKALPKDYPYRDNVLELIYGLLDKLETKQRQKQGKEDELLIMSLKQIYRDKIAEIERESEQRGEQKGEQKGKLKTVPLLRQLGMSVEEIATRLELPLEDVIKADTVW